jgi:hypothetical protein
MRRINCLHLCRCSEETEIFLAYSVVRHSTPRAEFSSFEYRAEADAVMSLWLSSKRCLGVRVGKQVMSFVTEVSARCLLGELHEINTCNISYHSGVVHNATMYVLLK